LRLEVLPWLLEQQLKPQQQRVQGECVLMHLAGPIDHPLPQQLLQQHPRLIRSLMCMLRQGLTEELLLALLLWLQMDWRYRHHPLQLLQGAGAAG
jgi:hypothetical protein